MKLVGWLILISWFPIRTQILILCSQTEFLKYSIRAHICVCKHAHITTLWTHLWTHIIINIWTIIYRGFWSTILAHLKTEITWLHNFCQKKKGTLNGAYLSLCTACIVPHHTHTPSTPSHHRPTPQHHTRACTHACVPYCACKHILHICSPSFDYFREWVVRKMRL